MGNYCDLLVTTARNPTMRFRLDHKQNHGTAVNENWGRELLELFSIGVGAYKELAARNPRLFEAADPAMASAPAWRVHRSSGDAPAMLGTRTAARPCVSMRPG
jgi:hypothetical protein